MNGSLAATASASEYNRESEKDHQWPVGSVLTLARADVTLAAEKRVRFGCQAVATLSKRRYKTLTVIALIGLGTIPAFGQALAKSRGSLCETSQTPVNPCYERSESAEPVADRPVHIHAHGRGGLGRGVREREDANQGRREEG